MIKKRKRRSPNVVLPTMVRQRYPCIPVSANPADIEKLGRLSLRQMEVLTHIATGYHVIYIAEKLGITKKTVEQHTYIMRRKLGMKNAALMTRFAIRVGLIEP